MTELAEDKNVVVRPDLQPVLTSSYRNCLLLFSAAGWAEIKLGIKRSRSEKEGTVYAHTILKKRKAVKSPLETGVDVGFHEMKKKFRGWE